MTQVTRVTVEEISVKPVLVKGKKKNTYSFKADGQWYRTNFANHDLAVGDVVSFAIEEDKWGKNVTPKDEPEITREGKAAPAADAAASTGGLSNGQQIVRQNALRHATALITASFGGKAFDVTSDGSTIVDGLISIARHLESYITGELDEVEAMAAPAANEPKAA